MFISIYASLYCCKGNFPFMRFLEINFLCPLWIRARGVLYCIENMNQNEGLYLYNISSLQKHPFLFQVIFQYYTRRWQFKSLSFKFLAGCDCSLSKFAVNIIPVERV